MLESEIAQARAALYLRPIAEAGHVPEGMIRIFMSWSSVGGYVIDHIYKATHAIDIYPPQQ